MSNPQPLHLRAEAVSNKARSFRAVQYVGMKECPKCKRGYGDEMHYCLTDGCYLSPLREPEETVLSPHWTRPQTTLAATPEIVGVLGVNHETPPQPKVKYNYGIGAILLTLIIATPALFLILFVVASLLRQYKVIEVPMPQTTPEAVQSKATPKSTPIVNHIPIMDEVFYLGASENRAIGVQVPSEVGNARIVGGYRVLNGGTVDMYLMTAEQYGGNSGGPGVSLDYKERKNSARLNHSVGPGYYYILFIGWNADGRTKNVAAEFHVEY